MLFIFRPTENADSKSTENVNKTQPNESIKTALELGKTITTYNFIHIYT